MKRGFATKRDAQLFAAIVEVSKAKGEYVAPKPGRVSVGELAPNWLTRKRRATAPSHYRMLDSAWRVHVQPIWGTVPVADVDLLAVEEWITGMVDNGASATTVLRAYGVLSGILVDAVKGKRLAANPTKGVEIAPQDGRRHVYLSADDVHRLADASGQRRALVWCWPTAVCGGAKRSRYGCTISNFCGVGYQCRRTLCSSALTTPLVRPRVRKARSVPVPVFVLDELSVQCRAKATGDLVFAGPDGKYLPRPKSDGGWFASALRKAGVQPITPHHLRHTCASLAISAGVNVLALQRMLGHTSAKVTLDTYADLFDDDLDAVAVTLHGRYGTEPGRVSGRAATPVLKLD